MVSMGLQTDNERQHASLIPLPTMHRWLILGIAHGSHIVVIGVGVLSEGLQAEN